MKELRWYNIYIYIKLYSHCSRVSFYKYYMIYVYYIVMYKSSIVWLMYIIKLIQIISNQLI